MNDDKISEDELERVRILNALEMYESGGMGQQVGPDGRMRLLPLLCKTILSIRKLNRKLIERLEERSWRSTAESLPEIDQSALWLTREGAVVHDERDEDTEFWLDFTHWMPVPHVD